MKIMLENQFTVLVVMVMLAFLYQPISSSGASPSDLKPQLIQALMCESVNKLEPVNQAVIYSINLGKVICFTEFSDIQREMDISHRWYHKGILISQKTLTIKPPRWSTFSSMQLRVTDIGPWQVDIVDADGTILETLRFGVTN